MNWLVVSLIVSACAISAFGQEIPLEFQLKCRLCNNALELRDCAKQAVCDNRTEQCKGDTTLVTGKKRDEVIACTRCCTSGDDCNKVLCVESKRKMSTHLNATCDSTKSDQASVSNAKDCITFTTCDTDQVCFAHNEYHPGSALTYRYGCQNKYLCRVLMRRVFEDLRHCLTNGKPEECHHQSVQCDVCCGDGGCNEGTCKEIKVRLYNLWVNGKFDNLTLQTTP